MYVYVWVFKRLELTKKVIESCESSGPEAGVSFHLLTIYYCESGLV